MKKLIQFSTAITGLSLALLGCGGGGSDAPAAPTVVPGPTTVAVTAPPAPPSTGNTSAGIGQSGALNYLVFDNTSPTTGTGTMATGTVDATAKTITFPAAPPFSTGLVVGNITANGSPTFNGSDAGGTSDEGNVFVFCSAGFSTQAVDEPAARAGQKVAFSGNTVALTNVAFLYGKKYNEMNCTNAPGTYTFGDGNGNLTMAYAESNGQAGPTLTAAQVVSAFSASGYTFTSGDATGGNVKFRAYSNTESGVTIYNVAVLLTQPDGLTTTSVLYLPK